MTEKEQINKMYDSFNKEQGVFAYYTCGLLIAVLGYSFNLIIESSDRQYLWLPILAMLTMFISLGAGIYFIKYRLSNYYNNANILNIKENLKEDQEKEICKIMIESNSQKQSFWYNLHWWSFSIGPIIMFIWLIIITLKICLC